MVGPSLAITKIPYYCSTIQDFQKSSSRRLGEYLDWIRSSSNQKWIFGKHFHVFRSAFSKWTILFTDTRPLAWVIFNFFTVILQQFGPFDFEMTLTSKVKVNRSTRNPSNKKKCIGLSYIVMAIWALEVYTVCWNPM